MVTAVALLLKDADKLTLGQSLVITIPHNMERILNQPSDCWLSNAHMTYCQTPLMNPTRISFQTPIALNLATLLPNPDVETPLHDCVEILAQVHRTRAELEDMPPRCRGNPVH